MDNLSDFAVIKKGTNERCFSCGVRNTKNTNTLFYLTEWELVTGASTDGLIYCENCIRKA